MYYDFKSKRDEILDHYHKRSNVRTTFHLIKAKFGDSLRSETDRSLINEALCKILCRNVVVLLHSFSYTKLTDSAFNPCFGRRRQRQRTNHSAEACEICL